MPNLLCHQRQSRLATYAVFFLRLTRYAFAEDEDHPNVGYCWDEPTPRLGLIIGQLDQDAMTKEVTAAKIVVHTTQQEGCPMNAACIVCLTG